MKLHKLNISNTSPVLLLALSALLFPDACLAQTFLTVAPHSQQAVNLTGAHGDNILYLEGRLESRDESQPETAIRLYLNGTLLDGTRLLGSQTIYTPENPKLTTPPVPRYSADDHCFAFPTDNDYIAGNGPFRYSEAYARTLGCPYLLQLNVGNLLRPGANELLISNGSELPFTIRQCSLNQYPQVVEESLPHNPEWTLFYYSAEMRARYLADARRGTWIPEERAHLLTALGTAELLRDGGSREQAVHDWQQALETSTDFDLRGEAAYRLAAERLRSGQWADERTEALVRTAAAVEDESWSELAAGILKVINHRPVGESPRLIITPPLVAGPLKVDGALDEKFWHEAKVYPLDYPMTNGKSDRMLPKFSTDVRFVVLPKGLAVGFTGVIPANTNWLTGVQRDDPVWEDNAVELFITPDTDIRTYYETRCNPHRRPVRLKK